MLGGTVHMLLLDRMIQNIPDNSCLLYTSGCISLNQKSLHEAYALLLKKHADFLDIDYIWNQYLETGNEIINQNIDWIKLDEAIDDITKTNKFCTKDNLYKATINQISQKYRCV